MESIEIKEELAMTYNELVEYLLNKYGSAKYDYFVMNHVNLKIRKYLEQVKVCFVTI